MMVFSLLFACQQPDTRERYNTDKEECERVGTARRCFLAGRSQFAGPGGRSLYYGKACKGGIEEACPLAFRATAESISPYQGAGRALGHCVKTGAFCDLALEMAKADGITPEQRARLEARVRKAQQERR